MKIAYVRTGGGGGVQTNAYALRTGGMGVKNWHIFAYVLYGCPLIVLHPFYLPFSVYTSQKNPLHAFSCSRTDTKVELVT